MLDGLLGPLCRLARLVAHTLSAANLEDPRDPLVEEELLDLPALESLGQVTQETESAAHDGIGAVLVLEGELEEGEDRGDVGEKDV